MSDSNKALVEHIFDELSRGNARPLVDSMSDEFRWTVSGTTKWSGIYEGKQNVLSRLLNPLGKHIDGRIVLVPSRVIAEGEHVAVEARGNNTTRAGLPYNNEYCFVFRVAGGKIREVIEYGDTALINAVLPDPERQ